jgi:DNA-binding NtrC family response regulator
MPDVERKLGDSSETPSRLDMKDWRILVVDDDPLSRSFLENAFLSLGVKVQAVDDGFAAGRLLEKTEFDLVVSDQKMPRVTGLELLDHLRKAGNDVPFVLATAFGTTELAVKALRAGADDVLVKPVALEQIELVLERLCKRRSLLEENQYLRDQAESGGRIVCESPGMHAVVHLARRVAKEPVTVLLTGESGTGKEVIASELHRQSPRRNRPFIKVNCAAVPGTLIESEFFGHESGAFTGATKSRPGKFEIADGGTIFLDEIGEIPLELQAKLLRVLEERIVQRVGGDRERSINVRVIAATNRNLEEQVGLGAFREDLFFRLNVFPIHIPPLRERKEDILPLINLFLSIESGKQGRERPVLLDARAEELFEKYSWPGNVREVRNLIQRAVILCHEGVISPELVLPWLGTDIPHVEIPRASSKKLVQDEIQALVGRTIKEVEDSLIRETLIVCGGNRTKAAKILGVTTRTLYNRLKSPLDRVQT